MLNQYPLWKNLMVVLVLLLGLLYALPNLYGQDPAVAVSGVRGAVVDEALQQKLEKALKEAGVAVKSMEMKDGRLLIRFGSTTDQQKSQHVIANTLGENYSYALTMAANVPGWLTALGGQPMNLGLDLRGGIHVLIDVDMETAIKDKVEAYTGDIRTALRNNKIRYLTVKAEGEGINIKFKDEKTRDKALDVLAEEFRNLGVEPLEKDGAWYVHALGNLPHPRIEPQAPA